METLYPGPFTIIHPVDEVAIVPEHTAQSQVLLHWACKNVTKVSLNKVLK
jgi:hypothetical protein